MSEPNPAIECDICRQQLPGLEANGDMQEHYCISGYTVLFKRDGVVRALSANQPERWPSNLELVPKFVIAIGPCAACGQPAQGNFAIHRDGMDEGPEVPLCDDCGSEPYPTCEQLWERIRIRRLTGQKKLKHLLDELVEAATTLAGETGPDRDYRRMAQEELDRCRAAVEDMFAAQQETPR
jgi:hypothetical protein